MALKAIASCTGARPYYLGVLFNMLFHSAGLTAVIERASFIADNKKEKGQIFYIPMPV